MTGSGILWHQLRVKNRTEQRALYPQVPGPCRWPGRSALRPGASRSPAYQPRQTTAARSWPRHDACDEPGHGEPHASPCPGPASRSIWRTSRGSWRSPDSTTASGSRCSHTTPGGLVSSRPAGSRMLLSSRGQPTHQAQAPSAGAPAESSRTGGLAGCRAGCSALLTRCELAVGCRRLAAARAARPDLWCAIPARSPAAAVADQARGHGLGTTGWWSAAGAHPAGLAGCGAAGRTPQVHVGRR